MHLKFCCKSRANILWVCTRQLFVLNDTESWNGFGRDLAAHPVPPLPWTGIPSTHYPRVLQTPPNLLGFGFCFSHCMYTVEKNVFKLIKILIKLACFIYLLFLYQPPHHHHVIFLKRNYSNLRNAFPDINQNSSFACPKPRIFRKIKHINSFLLSVELADE